MRQTLLNENWTSFQSLYLVNDKKNNEISKIFIYIMRFKVCLYFETTSLLLNEYIPF